MDFGLSQIVTEPTRNSHILDVFLTSRPDLFDCRVAKSVLKSDHLAVYINCDQSRGGHRGAKRQIRCYSCTSPADMARLNTFCSDYNWNAIVNGIDHGTLSVNQAFADFVAILHYALEHIVGYRTVTVRERDPPYITPAIRVLLRKRNKLLRRGKIDSAQSITIRIGKMIAGVRSKLLSKASASDTKQLWQLLRSTRNWSRSASNSTFQRSSLSLTANDLNAYLLISLQIPITVVIR